VKKLAALLLASCAVTAPLTASNGDLADHRDFVLARDEGERLARATRYLERHPSGAFAAEVRGAFAAEEPAYYRACQKSRSRAVDYLAWLPHGPHADAAVALIISFDEHQPEDEQSRMLRAARENEARLERAAEDRSDAENVALETLRIVVQPVVYGRKLEEDGELTRYLLAGRSIGATPSLRTRTRRFTVPARSGPVERTLEITLHVERDDGDVVTAAEVSGPALFARMAEASMLREVSAAEAERYVRDVVSAMARARGGELSVEFGPDRIRVGAKSGQTRQPGDGGL
jgi:hypothetical protein